MIGPLEIIGACAESVFYLAKLAVADPETLDEIKQCERKFEIRCIGDSLHRNACIRAYECGGMGELIFTHGYPFPEAYAIKNIAIGESTV